jgi:hypothetical protein
MFIDGKPGRLGVVGLASEDLRLCPCDTTERLRFGVVERSMLDGLRRCDGDPDIVGQVYRLEKIDVVHV